ncbi:MAG: hypothetical protein WBN69_08575 [Eudoraea sp.]
MTSSDKIDGMNRKASKNALVRSLETNNKCLISLENNLNSYICEPKTSLLFERLSLLKRSLAELKKSQLELINGLKDSSVYFEEAKSRISRQLETYNTLEIKVLEYIGMSKMHC